MGVQRACTWLDLRDDRDAGLEVEKSDAQA